MGQEGQYSTSINLLVGFEWGGFDTSSGQSEAGPESDHCGSGLDSPDPWQEHQSSGVRVN